MLADKKVIISNYPGTAIEIARGLVRVDGSDMELIDIPGIHNLAYQAENEIVARRILTEEKPDVLIQVADTKNLKRMYLLTAILAEFGIPLVFVLNMADEASQRGLKAKRHIIEEMLGTEVIETVASEGVGISALPSAIAKARIPSLPVKFPAVIAETIDALAALMPERITSKRALAALCLSDDRETSRWALETSALKDNENASARIDKARMAFYQPLDLAMARAREQSADALYAKTVYSSAVTSSPLMEKVGDFAQHPFAGFLLLFSIITALYFIVGRFAAGVLVDFLVNDVFGDIVGPRLASLTSLIPFEFVREAITGKYGLYTMGFVPAVGLVLPIIVFFFFTFGFIEDSGYFSRLSILLDPLFKKIGLNGKAVLPIVLGFSCVTMATISTRVLDSKKERFIAIFLLSLGIPCSAKLSVILVVLARQSFSDFVIVFGVVFSLMIATGYLLGRLMPSEPSHFIMDIPPIRIPSVMNILQKTWYRSVMFLKEAMPLFLIGAFSLFLADQIGFLVFLERAASPVIKGFLGLPPAFAESLIMGFIRGEAGIAVLKKLVDAGAMNNRQLVVAMIVTILFIPCITNFFLIIKEQGSKRALAIIVAVTATAILAGGAMNYILTAMNSPL
jgi:ferrous iron transport protein B